MLKILRIRLNGENRTKIVFIPSGKILLQGNKKLTVTNKKITKAVKQKETPGIVDTTFDQNVGKYGKTGCELNALPGTTEVKLCL